VAGYVDIVGFVRVAQTFTAHMTGNTVHLAERVTRADWHSVVITAVALLAFILGSIAGRAIIEVGARRRYRRIASFTLMLEAALIAIAIVTSWITVPGRAMLEIIIVLAGAMGLQTATLTRVGPLTVHTTFVTGMLNKLAQLVAHALFLVYDTVIGKLPRHSERRQVIHDAMYICCIWLMYFVGAIVGAVLASATGLRCLLLPLGILAVAIVIDQLQPLSLQEERDEVKQAA
jgi:uncharacterized membrane protein YoaK (UPF0700 family)